MARVRRIARVGRDARRAAGVLVAPTTWRMAWRNVGRNRRRSAVVVGSVAVGLGGALLAIALVQGTLFQLVETAIATDLGHVQVHARGWDQKPDLALRIEDGAAVAERLLGGIPAVRHWAPRIRAQGLVRSPRASAGIHIVGVDLAREPEVSLLPGAVVDGRFLDGHARRLVIGRELARRLRVDAGDKVVVSTQNAERELTGEAFRVIGIFESASEAVDGGTALMSLADARNLLALDDAVSELVVVAAGRDAVPALRDAIRARAGPELEVRSWDELRPSLTRILGFFEANAWLLYGIVFVAMAFGIANVLMMAVQERTAEIGMLVSIGMRPGRMLAIVSAESVLLTAVGLALGVGLGLSATFALADGIDLAGLVDAARAYGAPSRLIPAIGAGDLAAPLAAAALTALAASLGPALRSTRIRPADAMRRT
jgi:putative ABC transport system permease protein